MNDKILAGTPSIRVPEKMAFFTNKGKLKEVPTLTKSGIPSMRNKKRVIDFVEVKNNEPVKVITPGYSLKYIKTRSKDIINSFNKANTQYNYKAVDQYGGLNYNYAQNEIKRIKKLKKPNKQKIKEYEDYIESVDKKVADIDKKGRIYNRVRENKFLNTTPNKLDPHLIL